MHFWKVWSCLFVASCAGVQSIGSGAPFALSESQQRHQLLSKLEQVKHAITQPSDSTHNSTDLFESLIDQLKSFTENSPSSTAPTVKQHAHKRILAAKSTNKALKDVNIPSNAQCFGQLDDTEFCYYEVICSDGDGFYLHDNGVPIQRYDANRHNYQFLDNIHEFGPLSDEKFHEVRRPVGFAGRVTNVDHVKWGEILTATGSVKSVSWINNTYITQGELRVTQAWGWPSWTPFPLFAVQLANRSLHLELPPMDNVVPHKAGSNSEFRPWSRGMLDLAIPETARVWMNDDLDMLARSTAAAAGVQGQVQYGKDHMVCYRNAVLLGHKPFMIGGMTEAEHWRHRVQQKYDLPVQRMHHGLKKHVVILDRMKGGSKKHSRGFYNLDDMVRVAKKYDCTVEVVNFDNSSAELIEYIKPMQRASILVSPHGAGLSNLAFMPRRAAVIEIYPYHMWCPLYMRFATNLGLHAFQLFSWLKGPDLEYKWMGGHNLSPEKQKAVADECDNRSSPSVATGHCYMEYKVGQVNTPIHQFEQTLLNALDLIGHRVWPDEALAMKLDGVPQGGPGEVVPSEYNMSYSYDVVPRTK